MILSLRDSDIADKNYAKGFKEGYEIGFKEGYEIGRREKRYRIVYNLLDILDNLQIAKSTGLTIEEVERIRAEYDATKGQ